MTRQEKIDEIFQNVRRILKEDAIERWLDTHQAAVGGLTARQVIDSDNDRDLNTLLMRTRDYLDSSFS